ncbi:MAG: J domain-containing protein [Allosphingosinicella sp.]|uniref:J domain-containing protein n=1 Tax=Allosphingosinicella sp. TaxID=2823234 RepID=UPI00392BC0BF
MAKQGRSNDWGFPRWRGYGASREAQQVRLCDRHGCTEPGDRPAPKSPNSPERWYFCERHAAEYNRNWNYFEGLSAEDAAAREQAERRDAGGFAEASHYGWGGPGDGSRSRDEMRALDVLELDSDADFEEVRGAYRRLAKENHPDLAPGDAGAAARFQAVQAAYEVLRKAEERRGQLSP